MSVVGDVDKIAGLAAEVITQTPHVANGNILIYKISVFLFIIAAIGAVYIFYKNIALKIKDVSDEVDKKVTSIYAKFDKNKERIGLEFKELKDSCDIKDRRLTTVETKVSDMRGSLELTVKDMIEHKAETDIRVSTLEKAVDKILPKLDRNETKVDTLIGKVDALIQNITNRS